MAAHQPARALRMLAPYTEASKAIRQLQTEVARASRALEARRAMYRSKADEATAYFRALVLIVGAQTEVEQLDAIERAEVVLRDHIGGDRDFDEILALVKARIAERETTEFTEPLGVPA